MASLGVIVARGASKRVPRKVIKPLLGTPLLGWIGRAAIASRLDRVVLSTEDEEVAAVARQFGIDVPFLRPMDLAEDYVGNEKVVLDVLGRIEADEELEYRDIVMLQATAPFTQPADIDACLDGLDAAGGAGCCFTARLAKEPPQWMFRHKKDGTAELLMGGDLAGERQHTQKLEEFYLPTGAAWALRVSTLRKTCRVYTPPLRMVVIPSERAADIDEPSDLAVAEAVGRHFGFALVKQGAAAVGG